MGRSVSVPSGASDTVYLTFESDDESGCDWADFVDSIRCALSRHFPSLEEASWWVDREEKAIAENRLCSVVVAEYCGLVSVSLVPKKGEFYTSNAPRDYLAQAWCDRASKAFRDALAPFGTLRKVGTFNNGEALFERVEPEANA